MSSMSLVTGAKNASLPKEGTKELKNRGTDMHRTIVELKSGSQVSGAIDLFRPALGWFTLRGVEGKIRFDDCISVITPNERVSIHSPPEGETCDEMARAKWDLDNGREHGWVEDDEKGRVHPYPKEKFEWEKKYEHGTV